MNYRKVRVARLDLQTDARLRTDWKGLAEWFRNGSQPMPALEGAYSGEFLALRLPPWAAGLGLWWLRNWRPWHGKVFDAYRHRGENLVKRSFRPLATVVWPFYRRYRPYGENELAAFPFRTCIAPTLEAPGRMALNLDYDLPENPFWIVRQVLDEVVQVDAGLYLGKVHLRLVGSRWVPWAYFYLKPRVDPRAG